MPARANRPAPEPEPEPERVELPEISVAIAREERTVPAAEMVSVHAAVAVPVKVPTDKSLREKRTTRIDPGVYDAVERELKRQKRSRKRASSTLSDLLDELLRNWLTTHNVEIE